MAEFHSVFCCPFLLSILIIEGEGGMGGGMGWGGTGRGGWGGRWKKPPLGTLHEQP